MKGSKRSNTFGDGFMVTRRLTQDFKEFLQLLNSEKIEYLLIGGYAVGLYGYSRPTKDMDIFVSLDVAKLDQLIAALEKFGFQKGAITREHFLGTQSVFRMGVPPNRLEILTRVSGVEFQEAYARRVMMMIEGIEVPVISYEDLKRNKLASNRQHDLADVERLEKFKKRRGEE